MNSSLERVGRPETDCGIYFTDVHRDNRELPVSVLYSMGLSKIFINKLIERNYKTVGDMVDISSDDLDKVVSLWHEDRIIDAGDFLQEEEVKLVQEILYFQRDSLKYSYFLKRAEGMKFSHIARDANTARECIRVKVLNFRESISEFMKIIQKRLLVDSVYFKMESVQEFLKEEEHRKIFKYYCMMDDRFQFVDFADTFVLREDYDRTAGGIERIINVFIGGGVNLTEEVESLVDKLHEEGFTYMNSDDVWRFIKKGKYQSCGKYVIRGKATVQKIGALIVRDEFQDGIDLNFRSKDENMDLVKLRGILRNEYSMTKHKYSDETMCVAISKELVLRDVGTWISPYYIDVSEELVEDIKSYIDESSKVKIFIKELYEVFSERLECESCIDNHNFLYGILKYHYPHDYIYMKGCILKNGEDRSKETLTKIESLIFKGNKAVTIEQIKERYPEITNVMIRYYIDNNKGIIKWGKDSIHHMKAIKFKNGEKKELEHHMKAVLKENNDYGSMYRCYEYINYMMPKFIKRNSISEPELLSSVVGALFFQDIEIYKQHIAVKGKYKKLSSKTVLISMLGDHRRVTFGQVREAGSRLKWNEQMIYNVFYEMKKNLVKISNSEYIFEDQLKLEQEDVQKIQKVIDDNFKGKYMSLLTYDRWSELPKLNYTWNKHILAEIIERRIPKYRKVRPEDCKAFHRNKIIVRKDEEIRTLTELIAYEMGRDGVMEIGEWEFNQYLINKGLTRISIPKELYSSTTIVIKDGLVRLNIAK